MVDGLDDDDGYGLDGGCWCCYGWLIFRVSNMYGLLQLVLLVDI